MTVTIEDVSGEVRSLLCSHSNADQAKNSKRIEVATVVPSGEVRYDLTVNGSLTRRYEAVTDAIKAYNAIPIYK